MQKPITIKQESPVKIAGSLSIKKNNSSCCGSTCCGDKTKNKHNIKKEM